MRYTLFMTSPEKPTEIYDTDFDNLDSARRYAKAILRNDKSIIRVDILLLLDTVKRT